MGYYEGKIAFITGGSSGIGYAITRRMCLAGADAAIFARTEKRLRDACETLNAELPPGRRVMAFPMDVRDEAGVARAVSEAVAQLGAPQILVNNAGMAYPDYFEKIDSRIFDDTVQTNLYGPRHMTAAVLPHMRTGHIVNVSSVAGAVGIFGYTAYCASKFGLIGFSEALRGELKPRQIRVSVLCPPDTDTPQYHQENKTKPKETRAITKKANLLSADRVAANLLRQMAKGRFMIVPGAESNFIIAAQRICPGLVRWIMDRDVKQAQKNGT